MTIIIQQPKDSNGNPQPMVYDSVSGKIIVDSEGYVLMGQDKPLINVPSRLNYITTPKTQTSGIQEAINYSYANNVNTIKLMDGVYDVSSAPFVNGGYSYYYQIILPSIPNTSTQFNLSIIGNSSSRGGIEGGIPLNDYKGGVTIRSTATAPSGSTSSILGCPTASGTSTNLSQLNLYLDGIHFQTSPTGGLGGFNLDFCTGVIIGKLYVDIDSSDIFPTTISSGTGAVIGNTLNSSIFYAEEISVVGYTTGVYMASAAHMYISKIMTDMCVNGLFVLGSTYGVYVGVYDFQNCQIGIGYQNSANNAYLKIGLISMGDQQTSGYPYDFQYAVQDNGGGGTHVLIATLLAAQTYTPAVVTTANSVFKIQFLDLMPILIPLFSESLKVLCQVDLFFSGLIVMTDCVTHGLTEIDISIHIHEMMLLSPLF